MKLVYLLAVLLFVLSGCQKAEGIIENNTANVSGEGTTIMPSPVEVQDSTDYLANNEGELSEQDIETAYELCARALTEYYEAIWNGSDIELSTFIDNGHLKRYTEKKIRSQYGTYAAYTKDPVKEVEIHEWEAKYMADEEGGYLYLNLPAEIHKIIGSYSEPTEFLVRNVNGKLVIVDWYTKGKDSYDFIHRGENQTIDNPAIWNDGEWVKQLKN